MISKPKTTKNQTHLRRLLQLAEWTQPNSLATVLLTASYSSDEKASLARWNWDKSIQKQSEIPPDPIILKHSLLYISSPSKDPSPPRKGNRFSHARLPQTFAWLVTRIPTQHGLGVKSGTRAGDRITPWKKSRDLLVCIGILWGTSVRTDGGAGHGNSLSGAGTGLARHAPCKPRMVMASRVSFREAVLLWVAMLEGRRSYGVFLLAWKISLFHQDDVIDLRVRLKETLTAASAICCSG